MECIGCNNFYKSLDNNLCKNCCSPDKVKYNINDYETIKQILKDTTNEYSNIKDIIEEYESKYKFERRKLFILEKNIEYKRVQLQKKQDDMNMYTKILLDITTNLIDS
jgi:hypothetical protein